MNRERTTPCAWQCDRDDAPRTRTAVPAGIIAHAIVPLARLPNAAGKEGQEVGDARTHAACLHD